MKSAENVVAFPNATQLPKRRREELAFLPAALEIVETPPSPLGRAIIGVIIAFFCVALTWAGFGSVDIVASATGKIVPSGRTKVIQPFETGVVRAIRVQDGQAVKMGDVLVELDPTLNAAERDRVRTDLVAARLETARLKAALENSDDAAAAFRPPADADAGLVAMQRQFLLNQVGEQQAKLGAIDSQRRQKEAERNTIAGTIDKLESVVPLVQARMEIRKTLFDRENGSKLTYLEALQGLVETKKELAVQQSRLQEATAALATLGETRAQTEAEFRRVLFTQLAEAERKAGGLAHDLEKAEERTRLQKLTAPVDGVVQQLAVHTIGGVVTPAEPLMSLVPEGSKLEIEAMVSNQDIGFVQPGQKAEIKVDTFNFTRYGLVEGEVSSISRDAIIRDRPDRAGPKRPGAENASSEPKGQDLSYAARVSLDRAQMNIDGRMIDLTPGMAVTVEIKTGARRILTYLLSPLLRYGHDSLRER